MRMQQRRVIIHFKIICNLQRPLSKWKGALLFFCFGRNKPVILLNQFCCFCLTQVTIYISKQEGSGMK